MAVGKERLQGGHNNLGLDMRSSFPQQMYAYENEAQAELLMQRSLSAHNNQHHRYAEMSGNFSSHPDYYGSPINVSPFGQLSHPQSRNQVSNGNWDGWSELQGINDLSME